MDCLRHMVGWFAFGAASWLLGLSASAFGVEHPCAHIAAGMAVAMRKVRGRL